MQNKQKTIIFFIITVIVFCFSLNVSLAQEGKSYQYDSIDYTIKVNKDSTVNITEKQTFDYIGGFNKGWRSISLNKIDSISDIVVLDGETSTPLSYSNKILEKTDPNSWGKYTFQKSDGSINVEWYYNLKDTKHTWIISYKVHGAIGFYKNYDELYWNLFTDYDVPVLSTSFEIILPEEIKDKDRLVYTIYSSSFDPKNEENVISVKTDNGILGLVAKESTPKTKLTVALDWPKGIVDKNAYFIDFIKIYWGIIFGILAIIVSFFYFIISWYIKEKYPMSKRSVVPEYEPKDNLAPAFVDVIIKERVTKNSWPATIIDLAVRGYVKIEEIPLSELQIKFRKLLNVFSKDYKVIKTDKSLDDLKEFERVFLKTLLLDKDYFSTKEIKEENNSNKRKLADKFKKNEDILYKELNEEYQIYKVPIKRFYLILKASFFGIFLIGIFIFPIVSNSNYVQYIFFVATLSIALAIFIASKFNPTLNEKGILLKADFIGFKMYLETAEKYRLQNLTPEIFEKYLPYAMIFGVEKKWAKNFDSILTVPPTWYSGGNNAFHGVAISSGVSSGFSASSFTSSFSSSFTTAFASSGASGGAGGGGGGAGGGGGGGGGGAS